MTLADAICTAPPPDTDRWPRILELARPGCFLAALAGDRPHRVTAAIEDAGWHVRDCLLWLHGRGYETIVLAIKPLDGTFVQNLERHRTGALNIEACRIATSDCLNGGAYSQRTRDLDEFFPKSRLPGAFAQPTGRWPPNLLLSHGPDCGGRCERNCPVARLDTQEVGASRYYPTFRYEPEPYPVALIDWLVRLIVPPGAATVLDPFPGRIPIGAVCEARGLALLETPDA